MAEAKDAASWGAVDLGRETFVLSSTDVIDILGLECPICSEEYNMPDKPPKMLLCHHTLCQPCLEGLVSTSTSCPVCRVEFDDDTEPKDFLNDFRIVTALDVVKKARMAFKDVCIKHNGQRLAEFCTFCNLPVCCDCIRLDHDQESGHAIIGIEEALKLNAQRFKDLEKKCEESMERFKIRQEMIANVKQNLDIQQKVLKCSVEEKFNEYCALLIERKETLIEAVERKIRARKANLDEERECFSKINRKVEKLYHSFKASMDCNDARELFALQRQFISDENELVKEFRNEDLCNSYEYKSVNEESFKTNLAALGNVFTKFDINMCRAPESVDDSDIESDD